MHTRQPMGLASGLFALLMALLWAGTSVTAREAVDRVPPLALGAIRFGLAAVFMLGWCRWEGVSLNVPRGGWSACWMMGLLLFLQIATFNLGVAWSNASHATLLVNTYIFWVAAAEHYWLRTIRLQRVQAVGLAIAAIGTAVLFVETPVAGKPAELPIGARVARDMSPADAAVVTGGSTRGRPTGPLDQVTLAGDLMLAFSALLLATKVLYTQHAVRSIAPGTLIFWHDVLGTGMFVVTSAAWESWPAEPFTTPIVLSLLYAGLVVSGLCFAGQAWLLRRYSASSVSVYSFATPVFGVLLAVAMRGDVLSGWLALSGLLVAAGIGLVNWPQATPREGPLPDSAPSEEDPGSEIAGDVTGIEARVERAAPA